MTSKREEKKKYFSKIILEAARLVFSEVGYNNATMDAIAKKAGVGGGTAYLYFKSKNELFQITMGETIGLNKIIDQFQLDYYGRDVIESSHILMNQYIKSIFEIDRYLLREFLTSSISESFTENSFVLNVLLQYDIKIKEHLSLMISHHKRNNELASSFDTEIFSHIYLKILIEVIGSYFVSESYTQEEALKRSTQEITFILKPYINNTDI